MLYYCNCIDHTSECSDYLYREGLVRNADYSGEVCRARLDKLKGLRAEFNLEIQFDRRELLDELYPLVKDWKGRPPNLRDIFRDEEIDALLTEAVKNYETSMHNYRGQLFVRFVARTGCRDEPRLDADGRPVLRRSTALHWAAQRGYYTVVSNLFKIYDRFDVNYVDEAGFTHFHAACASGCCDAVMKFLDLGQDANCLPREPNARSVSPPLHWAVMRGHKKVVELLVRKGANPNLATAEGWTPLHIICRRDRDDGFAKTFVDIVNQADRSVLIDARDKGGRTALQWAIARDQRRSAEFLLRAAGADPNLADKDGWTSLHIICHKKDTKFANKFFELAAEANRPVLIDAANSSGRTPLHFALEHGVRELIELLLRRGASPNLGDNDGWTPLHTMCKKEDLAEMLKMFLELCDELQQTVLIDAKDSLGRTPLQWAVANLMPDTVDYLFDRGADLANFVFPSQDYFGEKFDSRYPQMWIRSKLRLASRALDVVERLVKRGYRLVRSDVLTIMKLFATRKLFDKSEQLDVGRGDEDFARKAQGLMMNASLSLYELLQLPLHKAEKSFTIADYFEFERTDYKYGHLPRVLGCDTYLCEIMSRAFFRRWALEFFLSLTRYRLPILCCEIILDELMNEDLLNICLAAGVVAD